MRQQFHAWAAAVRASVEAIRALAEEAREKEQALEHLLRTPKPDPLAIRRFTLDIKARRLEIERLIAALPTLDETGEADAPGDVLRRAPATGRRVVSSR